MRNLLRIWDLEADELFELLESAASVKADPGSVRDTALGKVVAVLFEKPSLRTRFSVEAALARIGAHPIGAYDREVGLGSREPLADAARVLERYCDAIVMRTFEHERVEAFAGAASVPVINALSDEHHPLQALADLLTIAEARCAGEVRVLKSLKIAWIGDGNNVARSLIEACALVGAGIAVACPPGYEPGGVEVTHDPAEAVAGADVVCTDVWASMGQEAQTEARRAVFVPYRVTADLMARAAPGAIFLHCLPAHRGDEVDADVIDGPASRVFDQAENRLHTTLAVFLSAFGVR
jgi:ornithine carbamoyltransferase